eukprot:CAMPEP_0181339482 /NCGR_PEP_ID=MMETSP1101-20121128/29281_1 /TAXON_ID=46948 /ORGANISM="Rhodomonas abbreviata, Strain Caron Lab Isolate" /LENGTH=174 /DNA_ID=CAMNT_0023450457 /DNA_START=251 /DNA_END=775 /DNA_ORIENTATION=-
MGCGRARGVRRNTRDMFSKKFGMKGLPSMSTYLAPYKVGDYVDIVVNGAIHKGMPYRYYHGRTGKVWNITKSALGVMVNKKVRGRIISKRLHVRVEHVQSSRCIEEFKRRVAYNEKAKAEAKKTGKRTEVLKRLPKDPKPGYIVRVRKAIVDGKKTKEKVQPAVMCAVPYELLA